MPARTPSIRRTQGVGAALLLAGSALAFAQDLPEPPSLLSIDQHASKTLSGVPVPPSSWPATPALNFSAGWGSSTSAATSLLGREGMEFRSTLTPEESGACGSGGFSVRLMSKMSREAQRYRREQVSDAWGAFENGFDEDLDSLATARRSSEASRVVTRSFHRTLDEELERLASTRLGLGPTISFLRNLSFRRLRAGDSRREEVAGGAGPTRSSVRQGYGPRADLGLRLDAHPALFIRTRFRGLNGRIEMTARDERVRLSMESPLGSRGRVLLSSGLPRDGQGWATLTFHFGF